MQTIPRHCKCMHLCRHTLQLSCTTMMIYVTIVIFWKIFIVRANSWLCMNYTNVVKEDTYMDLRMFRQVGVPSVQDCAARCLMSSACASFNFDLITRTCDLNSDTSTDTDVDGRRGYVFSDIHHWSKSLTGPCSTVSCPNTSVCSVDRMGVTRCEIEFQGCGIPPLPPGSTVTYGGHFLNAVAHYTCAEDYKTCHNNQSSICRSNGQWDHVSGLCGQYRWTDLVANKVTIPCGPVSEMQLTLNGRPTNTPFEFTVDIIGDGDDILFHVKCRSEKFVFCSRVGGSWGSETIHSNTLIVANQNFELVITFRNGQYKVDVDDTELDTIPAPVPGLPSRIAIYKDVEKHEISILI